MEVVDDEVVEGRLLALQVKSGISGSQSPRLMAGGIDRIQIMCGTGRITHCQ